MYKEAWMPHIGERLACNDESSSREDPFAVVIKKGSETVGHVIALLFILLAVVWVLSLHSYWDRRSSVNLHKKGLELPCLLVWKSSRTKSGKNCTAQLLHIIRVH